MGYGAMFLNKGNKIDKKYKVLKKQKKIVRISSHIIFTLYRRIFVLLRAPCLLPRKRKEND